MTTRRKKSAAKRRPARRVQAPATAPAAPAALQLSPEQSLQEMALLLHRMNQNLFELAKAGALLLELRRELLGVERVQAETQERVLGVLREQLDLAREARKEVEAMKASGAEAQATALRVLDVFLQRAGTEPEPRTTSDPALAPATTVRPPATTASAPAVSKANGVTVRSA